MTEKPTFDPAEELKKAKLKPFAEIQRPPVIITIGGKPVLMLGSFSVVSGKPKARKGFLMGVIATAAAIGSCSIEGIKGDFPDRKNQILYFDTEQGAWWGQIAFNRICKNMGVDNPVNMHYFNLQPYSPQERLSMIDHEISTRENISLVIIDGCRDLLAKGINDEEEATIITTHILKWCASKQIHIMTALHMNKGDDNVRGHIGTELVNKSEMVISVVKEKDETITTIKAYYSRGEPFNSFSFCVGDDGLPRLTEVNRPAATRKADLELSRFEHVFNGHQRMNHALMVERFKEAAKVETSSAKKHIAAALVKGIIIKDDDDGYYSLAHPKTESNDESTPF